MDLLNFKTLHIIQLKNKKEVETGCAVFITPDKVAASLRNEMHTILVLYPAKAVNVSTLAS